MTETSFEPDWRSPPGDTIKEIMQERGLSPADLVTGLKFVDDLLDGSQEITPNIAKRLSNFLGASQEFWLARDAHYRRRK